MLILDAIWLVTMAKRFYGQYIGHLMAEAPNFLPAVIFYAIYAMGVAYFVICPAIENAWGFPKVLFSGAFLGLLAYATYDLTNQATLRDWPTIVTVVDLAWGAILTSIVSSIAFVLTKHFSM